MVAAKLFILFIVASVTCAYVPTFRDYMGINHAVWVPDPLWNYSAGWSRLDLMWNTLQPSQDWWDNGIMDQYTSYVLGMQSRNVKVLVTLDYVVDWALDTSYRSWYQSPTEFYEIVPNGDGSYEMNIYSVNGNGAKTLSSSAHLDNGSNFPPANVADWTTYVTKVVSTLTQPPYSVTHFQIWNEAETCSGFWYGSWDDYFNKIHLPAANIIRAYGAKVVYGGYPACGNVYSLPTLLDTYNAWSTLDVIDCHYLNGYGINIMRTAAVQRGYKNLGVWQTELGYDPTENWIPNHIPRYVYYSLVCGWTYQYQWTAMFYSISQPSTASYEVGRYMYDTNGVITWHGLGTLQLGNMLYGDLHIFNAYVSNSLNLPVDVWSGDESNSVEPFYTVWRTTSNLYNNRLVITTHVEETVSSDTSVSFTIRVPSGFITKVERIDLTGDNTVDATSTLQAVDSGTSSFSVPTGDAAGSLASAYNGNAVIRMFYTVVTFDPAYVCVHSPSYCSVSPSGSFITVATGGYLVDAERNVYTLTTAGQVAVNGVPDTTTSYVIELAIVNNVVYQQNFRFNWYEKASLESSWVVSLASPVPSPSGTSLTAAAGMITDLQMNSWSLILGHVAENGISDTGTYNTVQLAYVNGHIWCQNTEGMWYSKQLPSGTWGPPGGQTTSPLLSPSGTIIAAVGSITDPSGNSWSLVQGHVTENGVSDLNTYNAVYLAYTTGYIWHKNMQGDWYGKQLPSGSWFYSNNCPLISLSGTTITLASGGYIMDIEENVWSIINGQVAENGVIDVSTYNAISLSYVNGTIWHENTSNMWYNKQADILTAAWGPSGGISVSPV